MLFCLVSFGLWLLSQKPEISPVLPVAKPAVASWAVGEPIQPIPLQVKLNPRKVKLGEKLFHDTQLSQNNTVSCASCHNLRTGGTDRLVQSIGINGRVGSMNSPTVFNSGFNFKQFWDGRAENLKEQIEGPINSEVEMGSNWPQIIGKLRQSSYYVSVFGELYSDGINRDTIKDALNEFERSLYTPNSPFDKFLRGDKKALTEKARQGYNLFKAYGCASCHQGINVGGNMFQTFGVMGDYFKDRGETITEADLGRYRVTGDERDRHVFKVPTLRNVALTPPYFHDGSAETLEEAVVVMAKYQLGRELSQAEIDLLIQFLKALTGEYKGEPL
ncbi:MAG: cytochrome-c peroxidase [Oscillatoria sp. SIO1A7]|nr:cytochrome-c peroxidase [Oscillatoria sp. SIO1A7]